MRRTIILFVGFMLSFAAFSQDKHSFSLGRGTTNTYNGMVTPYYFRGAKVINMNYGNEKLLKKEWKTLLDMGISFSKMRMDYDFSNKLKSGQPIELELDAIINKSILKKVIETNRFSIHTGFITSIQGIYQVYDYSSIPDMHGHVMDFFQLGISEGISASMQLKLKKIILQNTTSYLLAGAFLYSNYTSDSPFYDEGSGDYLTFAAVNKRIYLENRLKVEFPLYIRGKFVNSFSISHDFKYEYSTIKDNVLWRLGHSINIGILFRVDKLDVDAM